MPRYFWSTVVLFNLLGVGALFMAVNGAPPPDLPMFVFGDAMDVSAFTAVNMPFYVAFLLIDAVYVFCYWKFLRELFRERGWGGVAWGRAAIVALYVAAGLDVIENVLNGVSLATGDVIAFTTVATNIKGLAMPLLFIGFFLAIRGWWRQRKEA